MLLKYGRGQYDSTTWSQSNTTVLSQIYTSTNSVRRPAIHVDQRQPALHVDQLYMSTDSTLRPTMHVSHTYNHGCQLESCSLLSFLKGPSFHSMFSLEAPFCSRVRSDHNKDQAAGGDVLLFELDGLYYKP